MAYFLYNNFFALLICRSLRSPSLVSSDGCPAVSRISFPVGSPPIFNIFPPLGFFDSSPESTKYGKGILTAENLFD